MTTLKHSAVALKDAAMPRPLSRDTFRVRRSLAVPVSCLVLATLCGAVSMATTFWVVIEVKGDTTTTAVGLWEVCSVTDGRFEEPWTCTYVGDSSSLWTNNGTTLWVHASRAFAIASAALFLVALPATVVGFRVARRRATGGFPSLLFFAALVALLQTVCLTAAMLLLLIKTETDPYLTSTDTIVKPGWSFYVAGTGAALYFAAGFFIGVLGWNIYQQPPRDQLTASYTIGEQKKDPFSDDDDEEVEEDIKSVIHNGDGDGAIKKSTLEKILFR